MFGKSQQAQYLKAAKKQREMINQPVIIRDIQCYAIIPDHSFGEKNISRSYYREYGLLERMMDHIESLANIANCFHEERYCEYQEGEMKLAPAYRNVITRMLLNEFSLYTSKPLTEAEFNIIVDAVYSIAAKNHENVHLLLSSFAVAMDDGTLLNTCLYVQCGESPVVELLCKASVSSTDVLYDNYKPFRQVNNPNVERHYQSDYVCTQRGIFIPNRCLFPITTAGGAQYLQAIEICLDHVNANAKHAMLRTIMRDIVKDSSYLPSQVDHIVTSNSTLLIPKYGIGLTLFQIDPQLSRQVHDVSSETQVSAETIRNCMKNKYTKIVVSKNNSTFDVISPCFGAPYRIVLCNERRLSTYSNKYRTGVFKRNAAAEVYHIKKIN